MASTRTYKIFRFGSRDGYAIRSSSLDAFRKKISKEYTKGLYDVYLGKDCIGHYKFDNGPKWRVELDSRWYPIDPSTGKIGREDPSTASVRRTSAAKTTRTYGVYAIGSRNGYAIRSTSLNALRKRLIKEYPKGFYEIYLGYDHIADYRNTGAGPEWWIVGGKRNRWYDIDPKTGEIGVSDIAGYFGAYVDENGDVKPADIRRR